MAIYKVYYAQRSIRYERRKVLLSFIILLVEIKKAIETLHDQLRLFLTISKILDRKILIKSVHLL